MALTSRTRDILALLPTGTYVDRDTDASLEIELPDEYTVTGDKITAMCRIFRGEQAELVRCSIDFANSSICLKRGGCTFTDTTYRRSGLTGSTESEKVLVALADHMGTIDHDDLAPEYALTTDETYTRLDIAGLINVSHDAVAYYTREHPSSKLEYDLSQSTVSVLVPRANKRKRTDG